MRTSWRGRHRWSGWEKGHRGEQKGVGFKQNLSWVRSNWLYYHILVLNGPPKCSLFSGLGGHLLTPPLCCPKASEPEDSVPGPSQSQQLPATGPSFLWQSLPPPQEPPFLDCSGLLDGCPAQEGDPSAPPESWTWDVEQSLLSPLPQPHYVACRHFSLHICKMGGWPFQL